MAATNNLQSTVSWCAPLLRFTPQLTGSSEPALTNANLIKQTILGQPFLWRQNRATVQLALVPGQQDYALPVPDFGFLDGGSSLSTIAPAALTSFQLANSTGLAVSSETGRPSALTVQADDNAGNIVFRLNTLPDQPYAGTIVYQKKPVPMTSLASLWAPLPDELSYIYNWGYLGLAAMFQDDSRFQVFNARFVAHLLGAQEGISDLARNLFLTNWLAAQSQLQRAQGQTQQGAQTRAGL